MIYLSYINLTPGLGCKYSSLAHHPLIKVLRGHLKDWTGFFKEHPNYSLELSVATKKDIMDLK